MDNVDLPAKRMLLLDCTDSASHKPSNRLYRRSISVCKVQKEGRFAGSPWMRAIPKSSASTQKIPALTPLPDSYRRRFSNEQALLGITALAELDRMNEKCRDHAAEFTRSLNDLNSIIPPLSLPQVVPVYYQYCIRASDPAKLSHRAIRRGVDLEIMHVDIYNRLEIFAASACSCPVAESTEATLQLPVYSRLQPKDVKRVIQVVRDAARDLAAIPAGTLLLS